MLGVEGWNTIFNTLRDSPSMITTWNLSGEQLGPGIAKPMAKYISATGSLTGLNLSDNHLGETGYVKAAEVQGSSFNEGDKVIYQGREMIISKGKDSDGDIKMHDPTGVEALADSG